MMNNAVEVTDLHVRRGSTTVFTSFDLTLPAGGITGILGPSGCGKTTLLRAIAGVQQFQGGTVRVLGQPAGAATLRHRLAYDTQAASVYSDLTVKQNVAYFARLVAAPRADVARMLEHVGLTDYSRQLAGTLSGGQLKRLSLAVALLGSPEIVVLDEPTVGLDPVLREELWTLFRALAGSGMTLIVSSHVMDEALRCDDLVLLRAGQLVARTTPAGLRAQTGQTDPDAAFLELIRRANSQSVGVGHDDAADPQPHGRHAATQQEQP